MSDDALPATVADALARARRAGVERLDAQGLLGAVLKQPRAWMLAHDRDPLDAESARRYAALLDRRAAGEPLAYLLGEKEFHGLALRVGPGVLVPRADTEVLVDWALECLPPTGPARVLDLGTGSGAIALALKAERPQASVTAVDVSPAALAQARANGLRLGLDVDWRAGPWFEPVATEARWPLIVSNPPYIALRDPHLAALAYEPELALTSGPDGLDAIRLLAEQAPAHLEPGGTLLLEHGWDQGDAVRALLAGAGLQDVSTRRDLAGHERCTGGRRPR